FGWWRSLAPMLADADAGSFPVDLGKTMSELVDGYAQAWVDAHENASKDAANKDGARQMFALLAHRAQERLRAAPSDAHAERALAAIDTIGEAERNVDANVNMKFAFEDLAARLARL